MNFPISAGGGERPPVQGFQLDGSAIGDVVRSVNLFRGDVNIPLTLVSLEGRNGLSINVTAFYASNVARDSRTWNAAAGTSVLGFGWTLEGARIVRAGGYFLDWGAGFEPLLQTGVENEELLFQTRSRPLWQFRHRTADDVWSVLMENGNLATFGGSALHVMRSVRWGNWSGPSVVSDPAPENYTSAWNLASIITPWGDGITYSYVNDDRIVAAGVSYTRASYISQIEDMLGQRVRFHYEDKEPFEYLPPHVLANGEPDPAYQDQYETKFLRQIDVLPPGLDEPEYSMILGHSLDNVSGTSDPAYTKRYLRSVVQESRGVRALPPMRFDYQLVRTEPNPGALQTITFPEGGTATYGFETLTLNEDEENALFRKSIEITPPVAGSTPRVWHGPGYIVIAWSNNSWSTTLEVYSFGGRWSEPWRTTISGAIIDSWAVQVVARDDWFAFFNPYAGAQVMLFRRDPYRYGFWYEKIEVTSHSGGINPRTSVLTGGSDFVVLAVGNEARFYVYEVDTGSSDGWRKNVYSTWGNMSFKAGDGYFIGSFYRSSNAVSSIYVRDGEGGWTEKPLDAFPASFQWQDRYSRDLWLTGAGFAAATTQTTNDTFSLRIVRWDEMLEIVSDVSQSVPTATSVLVANVLANGAELRRFDGAEWQMATFPAATDSAQFAYGDDVAVMTISDGTRESSTIARYIPDTASWSFSSAQKKKKSESVFPEPERRRRRDLTARAAHRNAVFSESVPPPTAGGDILTVGRDIYRRERNGTWQIIGATPLLIVPGSLMNQGPSYLAFEDTILGTSDVQTTVVFFANGQIANEHWFPGEKLLPATQTPLGGEREGMRAFVTYPAADSPASPSRIILHRILNRSVSDEQTDAVAASVTIDAGSGRSIAYYEYDARTAVLDASGEVVQFPRVEQTWSDGDGNPIGGRSETSFYNGLPEPLLAKRHASLAVRELEDVSEYPALMTGRVRETRNYDANGLETSLGTDEWKVLKLRQGSASVLGVNVPVTQIVSARRIEIGSALELFVLPSSDATSLDTGTISSDVRNAFAAAGLALVWNATVEVEQAGLAWRIVDGSETRVYPIRARTADLQVYGSITRIIENEYDETSGQLVAEASTQYDAQGIQQRIVSRRTYAWQVPAYTGMRDARLLQALAEERITNETANVTVNASASTYRDDWNGVRVWANEALWIWRGTTEVAPAFNFTAGAANNDYMRTNRVSARNAQGQIVVQQALLSPVQSAIFDTSGYRNVATFSNADLSLPAVEASWMGFETYETRQGWSASRGSIATLSTEETAHTGRRSLRMPGGGTVTLSNRFGFQVVRGKAVFSAWVKTPQGFDPAAAAFRFDLTPPTGTSLVDTLAIPDTQGIWQQVMRVLDVPATGAAADAIVTIDVRLTSSAADVFFLDDVRFGPLTGELSVDVYDDETFDVQASLDQTGAASRIVSDAFGNVVATIGPDAQVTAVTVRSYSRDRNGDAFDPSDPNSIVTVAAAEGGFLDDFSDANWQARWSSPAPAQWQIDGDALEHTANTAGSITLREPNPASNAAVRLELDFDPAAPPDQPLGIRIDGAFTIQWSEGTWQLLDAAGGVLQSAAQPLLPGSWMLIAQKHAVVFLAAGRQVLGRYFASPVSGALTLFTGNAGVAFGQIFVLRQPRVAAHYLDGSNKELQQQTQGEEGAVVSGTLYDALGRAIVKSKSMRYDGQVFGYRPSFITSFDPVSGLMEGDLNDYYSGGERSDDEGYPYVRQRFADSPDGEAVELGAPGATLAIRPGNRRTTRLVRGLNVNNGTFDYLPAAQYYLSRSIDPNDNAGEVIATAEGFSAGERTIGADAITLNASFAYDERLRLTTITPPKAFTLGWNRSEAETRYTLDGLGQAIQRDTPDVPVTNYVYDDAGRPRFMHTGLLQTQNTWVYRAYDVLGRIEEEGTIHGNWSRATLQGYANGTWPANETDGWAVRYRYDGEGQSPYDIGRLVSVLQNRGAANEPFVQRVEYDAAGNIVAMHEESDDSYEVRYAYNAAGELLETTYPAGTAPSEVTNTFDALGNLVAVGNASDPAHFAAYQYNASGAIESASLGSGAASLLQTWRYNSPGWPVAIENDLLREELAYWERPGYEGAEYYDGRIARVTDTFDPAANGTGSEWLAAYDGGGRLRTADNTADPNSSLGTGTGPMLYDANGNLTSFNDGTSARSMVYSRAGNQIEQVDTRSGYDYDAAGWTIRTADGIRLTYDLRTGLTTRVELAQNGALDIGYDAGGARRRKSFVSGGAETSSVRYFRGPLGGPLAEHVTTGTSAERVGYVYGPTGLLAIVTPALEGLVLSDHLGSTRLVVTPSREVIAAFSYRPFGQPLGTPVGTRADLVRYRFTGQEFDSETGFYNYNARLYDLATFRFLTTDPLAQYFSPYLYVGNDPLNLIDPSGEFGFFATLIILAVVGAVVGGAIAGASYGIEVAASQTKTFSWGDFGKAVGIGALTGAVTGALGFGIGAALGGAMTAAGIGMSIGAQVVRGLVTGAITGAVTGFAGRVTENLILYGPQSWSDGLWQSTLMGGVVGGVMGSAGHALGRAFQRVRFRPRGPVGGGGNSTLSTGELNTLARSIMNRRIAPGRAAVSDLMKMVPKGTPNTWTSGTNIAHGSKYVFRDAQNKKWTVRFHSPDSTAPADSFSRSNWSAKVERDFTPIADNNRTSMLRRDGTFMMTRTGNAGHRQMVNESPSTHLPMRFF